MYVLVRTGAGRWATHRPRQVAAADPNHHPANCCREEGLLPASCHSDRICLAFVLHVSREPQIMPRTPSRQPPTSAKPIPAGWRRFVFSVSTRSPSTPATAGLVATSGTGTLPDLRTAQAGSRWSRSPRSCNSFGRMRNLSRRRECRESRVLLAARIPGAEVPHAERPARAGALSN